MEKLSQIKAEIERAPERRAELWHVLSQGHDSTAAAEVKELEERIGRPLGSLGGGLQELGGDDLDGQERSYSRPGRASAASRAARSPPCSMRGSFFAYSKWVRLGVDSV